MDFLAGAGVSATSSDAMMMFMKPPPPFEVLPPSYLDVSSSTYTHPSFPLADSFHLYQEAGSNPPPPPSSQLPPSAPPPISYLIKENRILINFKKINHIEKYILRSRDFLKKNFDLVHSQIKESTSVKRCCSNQIHDVASYQPDIPNSDLYLEFNQLNDQNIDPVREKDVKKSKKKKKRKPLEEVKDMSKYVNSDTIDPVELEKRSKRKKKKHDEKVKKKRAKQNVYTALDFLEFKKNATTELLNSIESILDVDKRIEKAHQPVKTGRTKRIEYSRSMIEFKLQLRVILVQIEQVHDH